MKLKEVATCGISDLNKNAHRALAPAVKKGQRMIITHYNKPILAIITLHDLNVLVRDAECWRIRKAAHHGKVRKPINQ